MEGMRGDAAASAESLGVELGQSGSIRSELVRSQYKPGALSPS